MPLFFLLAKTVLSTKSEEFAASSTQSCLPAILPPAALTPFYKEHCYTELRLETLFASGTKAPSFKPYFSLSGVAEKQGKGICFELFSLSLQGQSGGVKFVLNLGSWPAHHLLTLCSF